MKNLLKISLVALFAAMPGLSFAAAGDVNKDPGATTAAAPAAANPPKYALAVADSTTDGNAASAGYVKGAYNAAIKAVNKVAEEVNALESAASGYADKDLSNISLTGYELIENTANTAASIAASNALTSANAYTDSAVASAALSASSGIAISGKKVSASLTTNGGLGFSGTGDSATLGIAASGVTSAMLAQSAVTSNAIATSAVTTTEIANGTILTEDINSSAVLTASNAEIAAASGADKLVTAGAFAEGVLGLATEQFAMGYAEEQASQAVEEAKSYTDDEIEQLETRVSQSYATIEGVDNVINSLTATQGSVTQGISGAVSGTTSTILTIMTEWGATTSAAVSAITSVTNGTLNTNVSVANPTISAASYADVNN